MDNKQTPADVLRILIPDDSQFQTFNGEDLDEGDRDIALSDSRDQLADHLAAAADEQGPIDDPVQAALHQAKARRTAADGEIRLIVAYAREFASPRYSMEALASLAGMSASNIRHGKAYNDDDIATVARRLGRGRAGPPADPELAAINTQIEILDAQQPELRNQVLATLDTGRIRNLHPKLDDTAATRVINYLHTRYTDGAEN